MEGLQKRLADAAPNVDSPLKAAARQPLCCLLRRWGGGAEGTDGDSLTVFSPANSLFFLRGF